MKTIVICIGLLFYAVSLFGQTNYYTQTKTFYESGYTYQCDVSASKKVTLYNKSNKWTYVDQVTKSTGKYFVMPDDLSFELIQDETWASYNERHSIINNAFSAAEKRRVKGNRLGITIYINPDTGNVDEVDFTFVTVNGYATIPVSVYRKIETELKKKKWFIPTAEGKKLNYIFYNWRQEPK